jgi:hypothetical protein
MVDLCNIKPSHKWYTKINHLPVENVSRASYNIRNIKGEAVL